MHTGNVAIILNAHFPYVRRAGRWPHGEESLHVVIAESYVPLLAMLYDLRSSGQSLPLTVSISPVLLEQLADPVIGKHLLLWLGAARERVGADLERFEAEGHGHGAYLARFYLDWLDMVEHNVVHRFGRNLVGAIRGLLRDTSEVLLAPATYAYLPPLSTPEVRAQLEVGAMAVLRQLGRRPAGLWLPGGGLPAELPPVAQELGLSYAVGTPLMCAGKSERARMPVVHPDAALAQHVVGHGVGYPGDSVYREFYRHHPESGMAYWRVTGSDVPQSAKDWYDPYLAFNRVEEHAAHFVRALRERLGHIEARGASPTLVLAFDADLFGHWWFEGVRWLQSVLLHLLDADDIRLVTVKDVLPQLSIVHDDERIAHPIFDSPAVAALRQRVAAAAARLEMVAREKPAAQALDETLLRQATCELLLAQSSDWAVLIATGMAQEYALGRVNEHLARFDRLLHYASQQQPPPDAAAYLREIAELDNLFPLINYRLFS